jgi:hypothetical protein
MFKELTVKGGQKNSTLKVHGLNFFMTTKLLSLCTYDGALAVWNVVTMDNDSAKPKVSLEFLFRVSTSLFRALDSTPGAGLSTRSHRYLAAAADEYINIFSLKKKRQIGQLSHHTDTISAIAFVSQPEDADKPRSSSALLSGDESGTICVWDCVSWEPMLSVRGHKGRVNSFAVHPTGKVALSAGSDKSVRLWDLTKGRPIHTSKLAADPTVIKWAPNGNDFIILYRDALSLFCAASGAEDMRWDLTGEVPSGMTGDKSCCVLVVESEAGRTWSLLAGTEAGRVVVCRPNGGRVFLDSGLAGRVKRLERVGRNAVALVGGDGFVKFINLADLVGHSPHINVFTESDKAMGERVTSSCSS